MAELAAARTRGGEPGREEHRHEVQLVERAAPRRPEGGQRQRPLQQEPEEKRQRQRRQGSGEGPRCERKRRVKEQPEDDGGKKHPGEGQDFGGGVIEMSEWIGWTGLSRANDRLPCRTRYSYSYMIQV